jgi:3-hydroxyacyl-[acyl-carrier-protein] dehydratase
VNNQLVDALARLPHGPEFRFIDRLLSLDPGKSAVGEYVVKGDEPFLRGHFPGQPIFPGVLLAESVAQLAGVVAQTDPQVAPLSALKLAGVRGVKITGTARPGEVLRVEARLQGRLGNIVQASGTVSVRDQLVLRGEFTLSGEDPRADSK